ncbi:MAG TPA: hypothetical protein VGL09_13595 [Methylomirabilota bacterium]
MGNKWKQKQQARDTDAGGVSWPAFGAIVALLLSVGGGAWLVLDRRADKIDGDLKSINDQLKTLEGKAGEGRGDSKRVDDLIRRVDSMQSQLNSVIMALSPRQRAAAYGIQPAAIKQVSLNGGAKWVFEDLQHEPAYRVELEVVEIREGTVILRLNAPEPGRFLKTT